MDESSSPTAIADRRFTYLHETQKGPPEAIDVHHIIVKRSKLKYSILGLFALLLLASSTCLLCLQGKLLSALWSSVLVALSFRLFQHKLVEKESVIILPGFGIQLETQYRSGRTSRRFVHVGNILKPVLNECLTPVTCYWSLALIIRDEEELLLVFKELRPPIKMLVPVWRALCAAIDVRDCTTSQLL